jgi:hypothetical protein
VAKQFQLIAPIDAAGLDFSRPVDQRVWHELTNVYFNNGFLETRPGLRPVGPLSQDITSRRAGAITAIAEGRNWSAEASSVGTKQRLAPTSTLANTGWTITGAATVHAAIDDTDPPDDYTTYVNATTAGSSFQVGFADLTGTPDFIDDLIVHFRAVGTIPGKQKIQLLTAGSTQIDEVEITNTDYDDDASAPQVGFMDFYVPVPAKHSTEYAGSGLAWALTSVNAFTLIMKLAGATSPYVLYSLPSSQGSDNGFTPAGTGWFNSPNDVPAAFSIDNETVAEGDIGNRTSVVFDGTGTPMTTITSITVRFGLAKRGTAGASVTVYFKSGGIRYPLATAQRITHRFDGSVWDLYTGWDLLTVVSTTNPATAAAWTAAQVEAGLEFGIEVENYGSGDVVLSAADLLVEGTVSTAGLVITQLELLVSTRDSVGESPQRFLGRLMATTSAFQRLNRQAPKAAADLVDILAPATAPTAAWANWDWTEFFGSVYFENSIDTTYVFGGGADTAMAQLTAPLPLGHTIWSFAQRLFKGDIIETGVRSPKRIAWSGLAAPDDWTGSTSGDLDLTHGGEGRIRKGALLSAMTSGIYLDRGIYTLHWTGDDSQPFVPRFMDSDTGIVGPRSLRPVLDKGGESVHFFLGRGPQGLGVYAFDGSTAQNVGGEIEDELRLRANHGFVDYSFAWVEPQANLYVLFVPEGSQTMPEQAWVYHIDSGHWTRWEFPFGISAVGEWTLVAGNDGEGSFTGLGDAREGRKTLILGASLGVPYKFDYDAASDWVSVPGTRFQDHATSFFTSADQTGGSLIRPSAPREVPIDLAIQTGALTLSESDIRRLTTPMRLWMTYEDRGQARLLLDVSRDGGATYGEVTTIQMGNEGVVQGLADDPAKLREIVVDFAEPTSGRHHMLRLVDNQTEETARQRIKLAKLMIEYEEGGDLP